MDPGFKLFRDEAFGVISPDAADEGFEDNHGISVEAFFVLIGEVSLNPEEAGLESVGTSCDEGEEEGCIFGVAFEGFLDGFFAKVFVIADPCSECDEAGCQPVMRG